MERRHYSENHPVVRHYRKEGGSSTVAERRRAVVARNPRKPSTDWVKVQGLAGLVLTIGTGLAFSGAESGGSWLLVGLLGTMAGTCFLNAIRQVGS